MKPNQHSNTKRLSEQTVSSASPPHTPPPSSHQRQPEGTGLLATIQSVLAAAFGVQSQKNRERDFKSGKFSHFVIAGLIFTLVFILLVYAAVQLALHQL
ncbi:DUF2970 domain-containing protein [Endozoicomonas sp. SM1973]|uniref:DUF2970 domain-containing protein n=1 Tax=Spartinivicinus marinus TaxID=2994442 RepID=A0A853ILU3_9GAMM|nr:DUF2970 domain-containing protein [Spartinivicinus marinus]MCX4024785.1 DUF2970 domain-containing protein [Spartinivicinus marinus]NYZ68736.1 DUF2970 domain-containing protein [Spartinivicinus marinus]